MCFSGIRLGAWDYLKWKHITPLDKYSNPAGQSGEKDVAAAKIAAYAGEDEEHLSLITPQAYHTLKHWIDFRASYGEQISGKSWLMRDIWQQSQQIRVN
jgi:hypothetical protein